MSLRIYVEGGGNDNSIKTLCRKGFSSFIARMLPAKQRVSVIASGGRTEAFKDFSTAVKHAQEGDHVFLLVDSEEPVAHAEDAWKHLGSRDHDRWERPAGCDARHAHLMVQCMEAWFVVDPEALAAYFKGGFKASRLPALVNGNVEPISKAKIQAALKAATKETKSAEYHKTRDGFDLLARIDPEKVCKASPSARRLKDALAEVLPDRPE